MRPKDRAKKMAKKKEKFLKDLAEAVKEVNLVKAGKIELKSARELLEEL